MSADGIALALGTVLAVSALGFVLYPLFFPVRDPGAAPAQPPGRRADDSAVVALREIEFDRATGKLSDGDYAELRNTYAARALREMRQPDAVPPPVTQPDAAELSDPIEARVRAYRLAHRECGTCGLRPEPDAVYCSTCGAFLDGVCPDCRAEIAEPGASFCAACGARLVRARALALT